MEELKKTITKKLIKLLNNKKVSILIARLEVYYTNDIHIFKHETEPYLDFVTIDNITINNIGYDFDEALTLAKTNNEYGYISDLYGYDINDYVEKEISLATLYALDWPKNIDNKAQTIISILKDVVKENGKDFLSVERFYFNIFDEFKFYSII